MSDVYKYRIWCNTDSQYEYWYLDKDAAAPTTCPTDTGHSIDGAKTSVVETIPNEIQLVNVNNDPKVHPTVTATGNRAYWFSPDYTKKTSWFGSSVESYDELVAVADGVETNFNLGHNFIVDLSHGLVTEE